MPDASEAAFATYVDAEQPPEAAALRQAIAAAARAGVCDASEAGELRPAESARIPCLPKTLVGRMIVEDVRNRFSIDKNPLIISRIYFEDRQTE
jgi:hypothetical protein